MTLFGIFEQPAIVQLAGFSVFSLVGWTGGRLLLMRLSNRFQGDPGSLPVGPSFVAVTIIFALFLGFLAADIWEQKHRAIDAAYQERSAMSRFFAIAGPDGVNATEAVRAAERYRTAVAEGEWQTYRNRQSDRDAEEALREMWLETVRLAEGGASGPVVTEMFATLDDLVSARVRRLAIGADHDGNNAWFSVIVLCLCSYAAMAIVHRDRPAGGVEVLTIFAVTTTFSFWFLALHDSPYAGGVRLEFDLLESAHFLGAG